MAYEMWLITWLTDVFNSLRLDEQHPMPHPTTSAIPSITPSPLSQLADTPISDASPPTQPAAAPKPTTAAAASGKPAKQKKPTFLALDLSTSWFGLSSQVFSFVRGWPAEVYRPSHWVIIDNPQYIDEGMQKDSDGFQKQFNFNSQKRAQQKKSSAKPCASLSTAISIDRHSHAWSVLSSSAYSFSQTCCCCCW
jgi:hypothetical protein